MKLKKKNVLEFVCDSFFYSVFGYFLSPFLSYDKNLINIKIIYLKVSQFAKIYSIVKSLLRKNVIYLRHLR